MVRLIRSAAAFAIASLVASLAFAQTNDEKAAAQLFAEGRAALEKGDHAGACPKFEASLKLARRSGTLFALANCAEKDNHLAKAADLLRDAIVMLPVGDDRQAASKELIRALEKRIPHVTLALPASAPADARVQLDDADVKPGASIAVDPGSHAWIVTATGHLERRDTFKVGESEAKTVSLEVGADAPVSEAPAAAPIAGPPPGMSTARKAGFALVGVGAASLVAGGITGGLTIAKKGTVDADCRPGCNAEGLAAESAGKTFSTVSTVTFIAGGALAVAGLVLVVTGKPPKRAPATGSVAMTPLPGGGAVSLRHDF
jgi:hypothetical protein